MQPLSSSRLKIKRANVHISALRRSIGCSFSPQHHISEQPISDGVLQGAKIVNVSIEPSLRRDSWGLIIGDIVTNLRASLDHIAWELAMLNVRKSGIELEPRQQRSIAFPLCIEQNKWGDVGGRAIRHIDSAARGEIERFQPYNRRMWPELNLLRNLELLANTDKHRIVTPCNVRAKIALSPNDSGVVAILNEHSDSRFIADTNTYLEPNVTYTIAVYPEGMLHPMSIDELPLIHNFIRDEVIPAFACFFK